MNPSNNFGSYRASLKAALWRAKSAVDEREKVNKALMEDFNWFDQLIISGKKKTSEKMHAVLSNSSSPINNKQTKSRCKSN